MVDVNGAPAACMRQCKLPISALHKLDERARKYIEWRLYRNAHVDTVCTNVTNSLIWFCYRASYDYLSPEAVYVVENGIMCFIWIGLSVSSDWAHKVFGVSAVTQINTETVCCCQLWCLFLKWICSIA